jgi:hypothetical protein
VRYLKGFARFWYDFIVGDDWKIAAFVVFVLGVAAVLVASGVFGPTAIALITGAGIALAFAASLILDVRSRQ